jgi:diguanylate cyclase (GGDEF)-like protein/PAS domain S-box-containing protein
MIMALKKLPIASKLTLFCVLISFVSLLIALSAINLYDRATYKDIIKDELGVLATVISNRSVAAIAFNDADLALSNLRSLAAHKSIVSACIYIPQAKAIQHTLAQFPHHNSFCSTETPLQLTFSNSSDRQFTEVIKPILLESEIIGYLYLQSDNKQLHALLNKHISVLIFTLIASALIALLLSSIFSRRTLKPLLSLGKTASYIATEDNYSHRASKISNDEIGQVIDSFNQMLDVLQQGDTNLRESEEKFRQISASSKAGIFQLDINGACTYANDEVFAITELEDIKNLAQHWQNILHPDDKASFNKNVAAMLQNQQEINISCRLNVGDVRWITGHIGLLTSNNGELLGYLGTINDVTEIKNAQLQLEQMAFYDPLTGLANRRLFRNRLEHLLGILSRDGHSIGLILLDLDHFKDINDSLGHDSGDKLLVEISRRLQLCVRASDTVARLGGDEFAIILPSTNNTLAASTVADKILSAINTRFTLEQSEIRISASAGISIAPDDSSNAEELIKNADLALYRAKAGGRNNYLFYRAEMNTRLIEYLQLVKDLRLAIERNEFSLVYQPQVDLNNSKLVGFEALIRWQHPTRGAVSPIEFIPATEENGLIIPLGRWVITTACKQLRSMIDKGLVDKQVVMAVNLSVVQFKDEQLVNFIETALQQYQLEASQFEIELTETVLMENLDDAITQLQALEKLGVIISIDDFGTGYSSLGYLKRLPVNIVKVDRSFVMDIPHDKDDMKITSAVIAMAHNLNYKVVAEGVETQAQLEFLTRCKCDYGQGYFFSKPLTAGQLGEFFEQYDFKHIASNDTLLTSK